MSVSIENILSGEIDLLRSRGISDQDILDLLFTLIFWKYISDLSKKSADNSNLLNKQFLFDTEIHSSGSSVEQKMEISLNEWGRINNIGTGDFFWTNKQIFKQVGEKDFKSLCVKLEKFFSNKWTWEQEGIIDLFTDIESLFANSISLAHLFLTPPEVVKLISSLIVPGKDLQIYDPFCRSGELLSDSIRIKGITKVVGYANTMFSFKISTIKSVMLQFPQRDIRYKSIYDGMNEKFDRVITNPPFGGKSLGALYKENEEWAKSFGGYRQELDFLCHVLDHLKDKGQAAIIVPFGILFSSGRIQQFRKELILNNLVEAVIYLPPKIFYQTGVMTAILFVNRNKDNSDILLVNSTEMGIRQRDRHRFSNDDVDEIVNLVNSYRENRNINDTFKLICKSVSLLEFEQHDFDLQFTTYQMEKIDYNSHLRSSKEVWNEIVSLKRDLDSSHKEIENIFQRGNREM